MPDEAHSYLLSCGFESDGCIDSGNTRRDCTKPLQNVLALLVTALRGREPAREQPMTGHGLAAVHGFQLLRHF